jgi:tetratricopeptide (TPR) repeat protein
VWAAAAAIVLAGVAAYSNSFSDPFILDDTPGILENATIKHLWTALVPPRGTTVEGRPVVNLSLAINDALGGKDVRGYHIGNLAIHLAAALVLFGLVRRTLLLPAVAEDPSAHAAGAPAGAATGLALAAALLWTVHPLQTESVTYLIQRAESIVSLFYLLTLYGLVRAATARAPAACADGSPAAWSVAAVAACGLGMASKEVMASAPLVALLYDRTFLAGSVREALRRRRTLYAGLAATWVIVAALAAASAGRSGSAGFGLGMSPWDYAAAQPGFILHYLRLCFWPQPLVFDYGTELARDAGEIVPAAVGVALLLAATLWGLRRAPWVGLLGVLFFAALAPSSSFIPLVTQTAAEHRMYLPLAAVATLVVVGAYLGWRRLLAWLAGPQAGRGTLAWAVPAAAAAAAAVALAVQTHARNEDYRTAQSIWQDTIDKRPRNARAHLNLGLELLHSGDVPGAIAAYSQAIEIQPDFARAYCNRANAYLQLGRFEDAFKDYARAADLKPDDPQVYCDRCEAYRRLGRFDEALADASRAARLAPDSAVVYHNRGGVYFGLGRVDDALNDYNRAIEVKPDFADPYYNRGCIYQAMGRHEQALRDLGRAIALRPDFVQAYNNRGILLMQLGRGKEAIADLTRAVELQPADAKPLYNRGLAYQYLGQYAEAAADYTRAIEIQPDYVIAYDGRALCYYHLGQYDRAWDDVKRLRQLGSQPRPDFLKQLAEASGRSE